MVSHYQQPLELIIASIITCLTNFIRDNRDDFHFDMQDWFGPVSETLIKSMCVDMVFDSEKCKEQAETISFIFKKPQDEINDFYLFFVKFCDEVFIHEFSNRDYDIQEIIHIIHYLKRVEEPSSLVSKYIDDEIYKGQVLLYFLEDNI
jgi:hypothetical protein